MNKTRRKAAVQQTSAAKSQAGIQLLKGPPASLPAKDVDKAKELEISEREVYIKLLEHFQKAFQSRREVEWRLALGFWAAIGAITYSLISVDRDTFAKPDKLLEWIAIGYWLIGAISVLCWKFPLQHSNARDVDWERYFREKADGRNGKRPFEPDPKTGIEPKDSIWKWPSELGRKQWVWLTGQVSFTVLTLIGSYIVIAAHFVEKDNPKPSKDEVIQKEVRDASAAIVETAKAVKAITEKPSPMKEKRSWISIEIGK